jgi:hypothetical protein
MGCINLLSLSEALDTPVFDEYSSHTDIQIKDSEKKPIKIVCKKLLDAGATVGDLSHFYFGYSIPHIGKEFDFLRVDKNSILNLEIKSEATEEIIKKQLSQNSRYLSFFDKKIHLFAYVEANDNLYVLNDDELTVVTFDDLFSVIREQNELYHYDLDDLFEAFDYLVSPFNSTDNFINGYYFLTPHQDNITKEIYDLFAKKHGLIASVDGAAGTGKSLLIYDYAKKCLANGIKPLIVHVAQLNKGHHDLMVKHGFSISQIKTFMTQIRDNDNFLNNFDVVLIDESQRLYSYQIATIVDILQKHKVNCIFTYDEKQRLSRPEYNSNSVEVIRAKSDKQYNLSKKIRTNKKLVPFINSMFDINNKFTGTQNNISLVYFTEFKSAVEYIKSNKKYNFIRPTPSRYNNGAVNILEGLDNCIGAAHEVIGQEFDNVLVLVGDSFYYGEDKKLKSHGVDGNPYDFLGMLYQAVTRARKKLEIVVVNNPDVFSTLAKILAN